jgi:tellurite resistance protein TerC
MMRSGSIHYRVARRVVIAIVGTTVLLLGVVMIVAPGPAIIVIPAGLAILGVEFAWARTWLRKLRVAISRKSATERAERTAAHRKK